MEAVNTGYFKDEKNRYGSRRYITNSEAKASKGKKGKILLSILLILIALVAVCIAVKVMSGSSGFGQKKAEFLDYEPSKSIVDAAPDLIPDYSGKDVIELNGDSPNFTEFDYSHITGENYSKLDSLGRCGTATAMLDHSMMPTEERGEIGSIKPSGWVQKKYPGIVDSQPPYLYNRCHLIAYALTGQNANEQNLITGTRYMNSELMLPYEVQVMQYLDTSDNHVLYRVSPYFKGNELLARGVEMEAYSVEDDGKGVCFHVFIYNIQPGIEIDYATGESREAK